MICSIGSKNGDRKTQNAKWSFYLMLKQGNGRLNLIKSWNNCRSMFRKKRRNGFAYVRSTHARQNGQRCNFMSKKLNLKRFCSPRTSSKTDIHMCTWRKNTRKTLFYLRYRNNIKGCLISKKLSMSIWERYHNMNRNIWGTRVIWIKIDERGNRTWSKSSSREVREWANRRYLLRRTRHWRAPRSLRDFMLLKVSCI